MRVRSLIDAVPTETFELSQLLAPITKSTFLAEYWERRPLLVQRESSDFFAGLLTSAQLDSVITSMHLSHPDIVIVNAENPVSSKEYTYPSGMIDVGRLYEQYADGGSISLSNLEGYLPVMANLCRSLEREMSSRFQANIYLTPHNAQGLRSHYDNHDVFVLQVEGSKSWTLYDTRVELPYRGEEFNPVTTGPPGEVSMQFELHSGDMLYLPRGIMHDASATGEDSLHITVGVIFTSWMELILEAVAKVGLNHPEFRRTLPPGFAVPEFDRADARAAFERMMGWVKEEADFDAALDHFSDDLISTRHSLLHGQLFQVRRLGELTLDSQVGARPNLMYQLRETDEHVYVACYGGNTRFPRHVQEPLVYALENERFAIGDLSGDLDDAGKIVLIEKLIREGLVRQL